MSAWEDKQRRHSLYSITEALRHAARGADSLSANEYAARRRKRDPHPERVRGVFGTWNAAVRAAGLRPKRAAYRAGSRRQFSDADCRRAVRQAYRELGDALTYDRYVEWARSQENVPGGALVRLRLGRWTDAVRSARIKPLNSQAAARVRHREEEG